MSAKLLINVNDATPTVVPDTDADTNAPDTGVFSTIHNDGVNNTPNMIAPIIGISVVVLVLLALVISLVKKHKQKKTNKFSIYSKGHTILRITGIMTLILITTFVALNYNVKQEDNVSAANNTLTVTTSDIEIDVDLNDKAVFATGESVVTIDSATTAGYTLMAYIDSTTTDLKNETNKSSKSTITMLDSLEPTALTNNTWGIATTKPTGQTQTVFTGLPTTLEEVITLKTTEEATTANDKTTVYYGTYITPDLDYGTYSGVAITYVAVANVTELCNPNATTIQETKCLQDFAGPNRDQIVDSMTPETQYTLMDVRDEKSYAIAKLADGNVWMTQNLDHDIVTTEDFYTPQNTDIPENWTADTATYSTNNTTWNWTDVLPESYDPGDLYWNGTLGNYYDYDGTLDNSKFVSTNGDPHYHIGNYYNWTAAVAMNNSSKYVADGVDVNQSICPAGWTLPINTFRDNEVSWYGIYTIYNTEIWHNSPLYFALSSMWTYQDIGVNGYYWSRDVNSSANSYMFNVYKDYDGTGLSYDNRFDGATIRCVARTGDSRPDGVILDISNLTYMQDFATLTSEEKTKVLASMTEGQQYQLKDNRDEKTYYVSKLADGNIWMTQNLDHDIVEQANFYTPANTDISSAWTPSRATYTTDNMTWNNFYTTPESYDPGNLCWDGTIISNWGGTLDTYAVACGSDKHYHIGNYYNWTVAIAMNDSSSYTTDGENANQSICPAGWRLPALSGDKSYGNLITQLSLVFDTSNDIKNTPAYFVYGGFWYGSYYGGVGGYGSYRSSAVYNDSDAYLFAFLGDGSIFSRNSDGRGGGFSVRCVAR
ncbi:hypothetical protein IKT18_03130 [Candidatus Saccharibacteria bacterium]|nr:hypothetical protein [Candidatus Saccharibacteria bacterium]